MKVKCIDALDTPELKQDEIYTVKREEIYLGKKRYVLEETGESSWFIRRFKVVEENTSPTSGTTYPIQVRCVYNKNSSLILGKVYTATDDTGDGQYDIAGEAGQYLKSRFEVVIAPTISPGDAEEARLWMLMRPRVEPGHCVCGVDKQKCTYHKD